MQKGSVLLFFVLVVQGLFAQTDSLQSALLKPDEFLQRVKKHHPAALQANLAVSMGEAELQKSRGLFDPKAVGDISQKYFTDKQYYSHIQSGLKVPTWFGIELKALYEQNQGVYLNPENNTPSEGLWVAGISMPIGQGLFIDERRAALRQAKQILAISQEDRKLMLNDLLLQAGEAYWYWFYSYNVKEVYQEGLRLAKERQEAVMVSAKLGDKPLIDTLEASIQVQNREIQYQEALLNYRNASRKLETFLWEEGVIPLELESYTKPISFNNTDFTVFVAEQFAPTDHPILEKYRLEIKKLQIDLKWRREQLKPIINLNYNPLSTAAEYPFAQYSLNNYKWGATVAMPLFLRKERGEKNKSKVKLEEKRLDAAFAEVKVNAERKMAADQWKTYAQQANLYRKAVDNYLGLVKGEQRLFEIGESSLFMVNSREQGYMKARVKWIELAEKMQKSGLKYQYYKGDLFEQY